MKTKHHFLSNHIFSLLSSCDVEALKIGLNLKISYGNFVSLISSIISAPQARSERIEQLENDLNLSEKVSFAQHLGLFFSIYILYNTLQCWLFLKQVESFRELYLTEQKMKLDVEQELKDCMV